MITLHTMPQPLLVRLPRENPIGQLTINKIKGESAITLRILISVRYSLRVALSKGVWCNRRKSLLVVISPTRKRRCWLRKREICMV